MLTFLSLQAMFVLEVVFLTFAQTPDRRRTHYALRAFLSMVTMPWITLAVVVLGSAGTFSAPLVSTFSMLIGLTCIPVLILIPGVLFLTTEPSSGGGGGDDDDGGGGRRPDPPRGGGPRGDVPLPDADPPRWRLRDHDRPDRRRERRGPAPEPARPRPGRRTPSTRA